MGAKRKTIHINDSFHCENCGFQVEPIIGGGCRNHCPSCLVSKHVDEVPGDRQCECQSLMDPIGIEYSSNKGYVIIHKCRKCSMEKRNKAVLDTKGQNDSFDRILEIMQRNSLL